jgi:type IV pilus assembly protein PilE
MARSFATDPPCLRQGHEMVTRSSAKAFTLIELLIVIAIIAILASIAYPSYERYVQRTRRADGREMLMRIAAAEERFYTNRNIYTANIGADLGLPLASENGYYNVAAAIAAGGQTFVLTATPQGTQNLDACGNLTINNTGFKAQSGSETNGKCW